MKDYNCPNCGAPIGYQDQCDYCGTRIEWRPYVFHLAPRLYYSKTYDASVIGMVKKGALGTENPIAMELAHRELFERLANQISDAAKRESVGRRPWRCSFSARIY